MHGRGNSSLDEGIERIQFEEPLDPPSHSEPAPTDPEPGTAAVAEENLSAASAQNDVPTELPTPRLAAPIAEQPEPAEPVVGYEPAEATAEPVAQASDISTDEPSIEPAPEAQDAEPDDSTPLPDPRAARGSSWTLPLLCGGIALVAACLLIPQMEDNRKLLWETKQLKLDLEQIQRQAKISEAYAAKVSSGNDLALAERLAQQQMGLIRKGEKPLPMKADLAPEDRSPLALASVDPPPPLEPYEPVGGKLAGLCLEPRKRLYTLGAGLMLMAAGLVLGHVSRPDRQ